MSLLPVTQDYARLFLQDIPMMDVRAPVEFGQGAFPCAENVPLLDDRQRELIGIEYKAKGQEAAIALGLKLATPEIKAQRIAAWQDFARRHPDGVLYCFRGGLRSRTTQQWLHESGVNLPLVSGGYKALRRFLLDTLEQRCTLQPLILVSGRTGTGKTDLLQELGNMIDLEGLAHHRGSTFGYTVLPQPSQIDFENALAIGLLKHAFYFPDQPLFLEDESRLIGRIALPPVLQSAMKAAPLIVLEADVEVRENRVVRDYIQRQREDYQQAYGEQAAPRFAEYVLHNLDRIKSRLGGERHQQMRDEWQQALVSFEASGDVSGFRPGIRRLLTEYYDPMYDYQLSQRVGRILIRGDADTLLQHLRQTIQER